MVSKYPIYYSKPVARILLLIVWLCVAMMLIKVSLQSFPKEGDPDVTDFFGFVCAVIFIVTTASFAFPYVSARISNKYVRLEIISGNIPQGYLDLTEAREVSVEVGVFRKRILIAYSSDSVAKESLTHEKMVNRLFLKREGNVVGLSLFLFGRQTVEDIGASIGEHIAQKQEPTDSTIRLAQLPQLET